MKVAINAPIFPELAYLELFFDFHLIICKYLQHPKYKQIVSSLIKKGDYVILDNYDEKRGEVDGDETFVKTALELGVQEIIVPDTFGEAKKTQSKFEKFVEKYGQSLRDANIQLCAVAHGTSLSEYLKSICWLLDNDDCDVIAIPDEAGKAHKEGRAGILYNIISDFDKLQLKPFHMLGVDSNPIEIKRLAEQGIARSLDTTSPLWCAMCGFNFSFENGCNNKPPKVNPDEYFLENSKIELRHMHNLSSVIRWAKR
jgi:hypothetical protein